MLGILPSFINKIIGKIDFKGIYEIRIRADKPVMLNYLNKFVYLTENGISEDKPKNEIIVTKNDIEKIILKASNYSIYAFNEQLKQGFITLEGGFRMGVSGNLVSENGDVYTLKDIYSLNIRVPHQIYGCSKKLLPFIIENEKVLNTIIIAPPACGKTTILRDLTISLNCHIRGLNILVIDEKNEICAMKDGKNMLEIGSNCDVYSNCDKNYGINIGIRTMRPDLILTDELSINDNFASILNAGTCGVKIISSVHSDSMEKFKLKKGADKLLESNIFDRYIILSNSQGIGTIEAIYDNFLTPIYLAQ